MNSNSSPKATRQISMVLAVAGLLAGIVITLTFLSGDAQGRVNLLYLLFLFAFLPVVGLVLSIFLLLRPSGKSLAAWILDIPFWPQHWHREMLNLGGSDIRRAWFFYQTQLIALCLGAGGLLAFLVLLLGSDVSFVWRSTLLQAPDLLPVLTVLSMPWQFWSDAQPSLELLQLSQDFRLEVQQNTAIELGQWWKYAFAAQCTYNLIPRCIVLIIARAYYRRKTALTELPAAGESESGNLQNVVPQLGELAPVLTEVAVPFAFIDWAILPDSCLTSLEQTLGKAKVVVRVDPLTELTATEISGLAGLSTIVLVKSWEPPMGELRDTIEKLPAPGLVLPLDWEGDRMQSVSDTQLLEWRRFCGTLDNWSVLLPSKLP